MDSDISLHQAVTALSPDCPDETLAKQQLLRVFYFGTDNVLHQGQVVIHEALVRDVIDLFAMIVEQEIPIGSVIPLAAEKFLRDGRWDDASSMELNNGSGLNYQRILTATGEKKKLSLHALGLALDINPAWNPCFGDPMIHNVSDFSAEAAAGYQAFVPSYGAPFYTNPGSFHDRHPVVLF